MWLVDPLDGTGSFIRMRSGYAINVALIESDGHDWHPILGIVALDLDRVYFGGCSIGTWKARIDDAAWPPRAISADEDVTPPYSLLISWNEPGTLNDLVAGTVDPTQVRMRPAAPPSSASSLRARPTSTPAPRATSNGTAPPETPSSGRKASPSATSSRAAR